MAAPTPVSAYLHSATMVKAGVYLIARFAPAFAPEIGWWRPVVIGVGVVTMLLGGYRALRQHDIKLVLAYGTVSQLGFIVALVGAGVPELTAAGVAVLLAHALFKACLFMVVGIVDHQTHTRDLRQLSGLAQRMPVLFGVSCVAVASMVGLPPTLGFIAKELSFEGYLHSGLVFGDVALAAIVVGAMLTFAYGARFLWGTFGPQPVGAMSAAVGPDVARPSAALVAPAALLGGLSLLWGLWVAVPEELVGAAAGALDHEAHVHLSLWHGLTTALLLSAIAVGGGLVAFLLRGRVERWQASMPVGVQRGRRLPRGGRRPERDRPPGDRPRPDRIAAHLPRW